MYSTMLQFNGEALMMRLNKGDHGAMFVIFEMYNNKLIDYATRFIDNRNQAKDIVADTFLKVWKKRDFENLRVLKSFMYVVIQNACKSHLHRKRCRIGQHKKISYLLNQSEDNVEIKLIKTDLYHHILQQAENHLPPSRKKIFMMIYRDQLSVSEIAFLLNISVDTVRVQKARALHGLRSKILGKDLSERLLECN